MRGAERHQGTDSEGEQAETEAGWLSALPSVRLGQEELGTEKAKPCAWKVFGLLATTQLWGLLAALRVSGFGQWKEGSCEASLWRIDSPGVWCWLFSAVS